MTTPSQGKIPIRHTVQMDSRKHAVITGVTDVSSFHENEINLKIDTLSMLITGEGLQIGKLLLEEGRLDVDGTIDSMIYVKPRAVSRWLSFGRQTKA